MWRILTGIVGIALASSVGAQELTPTQNAQIRAADVVILGEIHDNPAHHLGQAALMKRVSPTAVVFEMLTPDMAQLANAYDNSDVSGLGDAIGWDAAGWPEFAIYQPVFETMADAVAVGAAAPRETVRAAFSKGAAAVLGTGAARFELDVDLPAEQLNARQTLQFEAHCGAMPLDMMGGMVEAQRLRDAQFSNVTLQALETYGAPVVVITGNGHARRDWGMPHMMALAAPRVAVFSVGFVEEPDTTDDPRFDMTVVTPAFVRPDPCENF